MKKPFPAYIAMFLVCIFACGTVPVFGQDGNTAGTEKRGSVFLTLGLHGILNLDKSTRSGVLNSAPSPILGSAGAGWTIPVLPYLTFVPQASFYMNYYLLTENGRALPAEIEQRTAIVPTILIDLPVFYRFRFASSDLSLGAGLSVPIRFAFAAQGVPSEDRADVKKINEYLWGGMRFLYPSFHISYDYFLAGGLGIGAGLKLYIPVINFDDKSSPGFAAAGMMAITVRLTLPKLK